MTWSGAPPDPAQARADIMALRQTLHAPGYLPREMHVHADALRALGRDPDDYPVLEGAPEWRVLRAASDASAESLTKGSPAHRPTTPRP